MPATVLTHIPPDKMASFLQTIFWDAFSWMKSILVKISMKFVPKGPIDNKPSTGSDNGLVPNRRQAVIWTNADLIRWRIYAALGGDELSLRIHVVMAFYRIVCFITELTGNPWVEFHNPISLYSTSESDLSRKLLMAFTPALPWKIPLVNSLGSKDAYIYLSKPHNHWFT